MAQSADAGWTGFVGIMPSPGVGTVGMVGVAPVPAVATGAAPVPPVAAGGCPGVMGALPAVPVGAAVGGTPVLGEGIVPTGGVAPTPAVGAPLAGGVGVELLQPNTVNGSAIAKNSDRFRLEQVFMSGPSPLSCAPAVTLLDAARRQVSMCVTDFQGGQALKTEPNLVPRGCLSRSGSKRARAMQAIDFRTIE